MKKILSYLEQLDLNEIEAKLYLKLLESGPMSVRDLAESVEIKRTTAYFHIDILIARGLMIKVVNGSKKQVAATDPDTSLKYLVEDKLKAAEKAEAALPMILTTLNTAVPEIKKVNDSEIQYYKGKQGVKRIYEDALRSKGLQAYVNLSNVIEILPDNFKLFDQAFKENPDIKIFEIVEDSPQSRSRAESAHKNHHYKVLPKNMQLTPQDILIYDDNVAIIDLRGKMSGVVLHNVDLYRNLKLIFDFVWKMLPNNI